MTCVAFPFGRGSVLSGNWNVSVALRLIELRYRPCDVGSVITGSGPSCGRNHGCIGEELFVWRGMRAATIDISSGSKWEKKTRCSEWQLTQAPSDARCCGVPGALMISSPFDICVAIFIARVIS